MGRVNETWLQSVLFYLYDFAIFLYLCYLFRVFLEINLLIFRHKNFKKEALYPHISRKPVFFVISGRQSENKDRETTQVIPFWLDTVASYKL